MTAYEPGEVLLVPFPFTDQTAVKQRPAVVLSGRAYNRSHRDLILAPITSQLGGEDETVLAGWQKAGLLKPSAVKPLLSTFDSSLVRRKLGQLEPHDLAVVRTLFARVLELPRPKSARSRTPKAH